MEDTLLFVAACVVVVVIVLVKLAFDRRKHVEDAMFTESAEETENSERVREILQTCMRDLEKQRVGGHGPWLPSLLEGPLYVEYDEQGRIQVRAITKPVTPGIALTAVRFTIRELSGSRFNLDALYRAANELSNMGEGA